MKVREIMSANPCCISPNETIRNAAIKMLDHNIGVLPVIEDSKLLGVLTDRDITIRGLAKNDDTGRLHVKDIMSQNVVCCQEDDSTEKAVDEMKNHQLHRLVVVDTDNQVKGLLSLGDIATKCHNDQMCGSALCKICS